MKKDKILFWTTTTLIFLFEGLMVVLFSHTELAKAGVMHLGYPSYFGTMLAVFKVVGATALILPQVKHQYKEWAYVGFGITFISALVSHWAVDGLTAALLLPAAFLIVLYLSYTSYHKLHKNPHTK